MRLRSERGIEAQGFDFKGVDGSDVVHELEAAMDLKEGLLGDDEAAGLEELGRHEGVGDAGFGIALGTALGKNGRVSCRND